MTATVTHNQSMSGVILNGARSGFFNSRRIMVFTRSKRAPSRVQFMPTVTYGMERQTRMSKVSFFIKQTCTSTGKCNKSEFNEAQ